MDNTDIAKEKVSRLLATSETLPSDLGKMDAIFHLWRLVETKSYYKRFGVDLDEPARNLEHLFRTIGSERDAVRGDQLRKALSESTGFGLRVIDSMVKNAKAKAFEERIVESVDEFEEGLPLRFEGCEPALYPGLTNYAEAPGSDGKPRRVALKMRDILTGLAAKVEGVVVNIGGFLQRICGLAVHPLDDTAALFSLSHEVYGENNDWCEGTDMVGKSELCHALIRNLPRYESVRLFPTLVKRPDTLYLAKEEDLPPPTGQAFERLIGFFSPASDIDRILLTSAFALPLWGWWETPQTIVDSVSGRGAGKSTLVYSIAKLLGQIVLTVPTSDWKDTERLRRRLVNGEGRTRSVVLVDNVEGTYSSPGMAEVVTSPFVSAMPNHGKQEVSRPKDFCVFATMNDAVADADQASRSVLIMLRHTASVTHTWEIELNAFIEENRLQIWSDILGYLRCATPYRYSKGRSTRFARYEAEVLSAFCVSQDMFDSVMDVILERQKGADVDADKTAEFVLAIDNYLEDNYHTGAELQKSVVGLDNSALRHIYSLSTGEKSATVQRVTKFLRRIIEQGAAPRLHFNESGKVSTNHRGVLWVGGSVDRSQPSWMKADCVISESEANSRTTTKVEYPKNRE